MLILTGKENQMTNKNYAEQIRKTHAFYNVSFTPEIRMEDFIKGFEGYKSEIIKKCAEYGVDSTRFVDKYFKLAMNYLNAQSRCASWAIVGPARFPVAKMEKRQKSVEKHLNSYCNFDVERILKRITRQQETQDDKRAKWLKDIERLEALHAKMKTANALIRAGKKEDAELMFNCKFQPDFMGRVGFPDFELRNNLANIKRLKEQVALIDRKREQTGGFEFAGGRVEYDSQEIRFNIFFEEKPEEDLRTELKRNGFKWSPKRGAWTRGAKTISQARIKSILGVNE